METELIVKELRIPRGETLLDLCCGFGRHLAAFERRGIRSIGVDLSLPLLLQVSRPEKKSHRNAVCADMLALPFAGGEKGFGVVVNLFTSFGYFETDEENQTAAAEMSRVLRPGGRFLMDLMNAEPAIRDLEPRTERHPGPFRLIEERSYDPKRCRMEKHIQLFREGSKEPKRYFESVRIFTRVEITHLLSRAGLHVEKMLGDFAGSPYSSATPRMIVLGRKAASEGAPS
jgi:SAM-dependent methyltransferase